MNQKTLLYRSDASRFIAFPFSKPDGRDAKTKFSRWSKVSSESSSSPTNDPDFSALPFDILTKIAAPFNFPNLLAASLEEAIALYQKAAALGDAAGQCNLGISYLNTQPLNHKEAVKWLHQASVGGHVRAQYQLALCLHQGLGVEQNLQEAVKWYLKAAEGGYVRAMYNASLCYTFGEGLSHSRRQARKWMKRAADRGHGKAQFEHGLALFSEGELLKAIVYLELATRSGETAATHVKNAILQQLSATSRDLALRLTDNWRALPSSR
ncbi:hypothetical protein Gotri_022897 [Gossypium trilobum]|uniref:F-box protein n=1 Tax=Gossypium trilobum TaxID=34281 RepID=A0A7J9DHD3_9ROSI|nr:hypothetical protein [Gossypium trilobum]